MSEPRKPSLILPVAVAAVLLLAGYVLSIGPAYRWLVTDDMRRVGTYKAVYAPVLWLANQSKPLEKVAVAYCYWWLDE